MANLSFLHGMSYINTPSAYTLVVSKQHSVYICIPPRGTVVSNKLDGMSYVVGENHNDVVVSGVKGELFCVSWSKLFSTYCMRDDTSLQVYFRGRFGTRQVTGVDWLEVKSIGGSKVFALFVPVAQKFQVTLAYGCVLDVNHPRCQHDGGDFVVCSSVDGKPNFDYRWVINGGVFKRTYALRGRFAELNTKALLNAKTPCPARSLL